MQTLKILIISGVTIFAMKLILCFVCDNLDDNWKWKDKLLDCNMTKWLANAHFFFSIYRVITFLFTIHTNIRNSAPIFKTILNVFLLKFGIKQNNKFCQLKFNKTAFGKKFWPFWQLTFWKELFYCYLCIRNVVYKIKF